MNQCRGFTVTKNGIIRQHLPPLFDLTASETERARDVFSSFVDNKQLLHPKELANMLRTLDIDASEDDAEALFKYLDKDGSGGIEFDEFLPWYDDAATAAKEMATAFQSILLSRRTVDVFHSTEIEDSVLHRAIQAAIAAPNRSGSEPWRFIQLGKETVERLAKLKAQLKGLDDPDPTVQRWTSIPGWVVVTYPRHPEGNNWAQREDFKSVACAIQNFMLSMWSEGIGSKWTDGELQRTEEFAKICGIDFKKEKCAGVIWYGFAKGGLKEGANPKKRRKGVKDVLTRLP